jgi:hypothetical protein
LKIIIISIFTITKRLSMLIYKNREGDKGQKSKAQKYQLKKYKIFNSLRIIGFR